MVDRLLNRSGYLCWHNLYTCSTPKDCEICTLYSSNTFQWATSLQPISYYKRFTLDGTLFSSTSLANIKSAYPILKHCSTYYIIHVSSYYAFYRCKPYFSPCFMLNILSGMSCFQVASKTPVSSSA